MGLDWVRVARGVPYFETEDGASWTPIGANDSIDWPDLTPLFRRRDPAAVEAHFRWLRAQGVTCIRLMLEYAHGRHRYFENPIGRFVPNMVRLWDDIFALSERTGVRILLTPMDTYFQWVNWKQHPFNTRNGGPCSARSRLMVDAEMRAAIKARIEFVTRRWGGSGALFAWDIWNEMHPAQGDNRPDAFDDYIGDIGPWLRDLEIRLHGRAHPQTASVFGPELGWKPWLNEPIFRHPALDFANTHLYEEGTIDDPADTVAPAVAAGRLIAEAIAQAVPGRPVFDSEHGPIHRFKDKHQSLPEAFDDEYFRHIQWAHLASGGAGGGMRWPNRSLHVLTPGMRAEQARLAAFTPEIDWGRFDRRSLTGMLRADGCAVFGCASADQAVVYLLRADRLTGDGRVSTDAEAVAPAVAVPGLSPGLYRVRAFGTRGQGRVAEAEVAHAGGDFAVAPPPFVTDVVLAIVRV